MANLKRRPDKDLNHENWDQEDVPEEKGEFKRATEDEIKNRRILAPRRKLTAAGSSSSGGSGAAPPVQPSNPFSAFAFGGASSSVATPSFGFNIPSNASSSLLETAAPGGTGSLFKIAGITPSAEPPTRASADSSTADTPGAADTFSAGGQKPQDAEPEVGSVSESEGITEESSNSSSLPWNVSRHQDSTEDKADSMQNIKQSNDNWVDDDEPVASAEIMQTSRILHTNRQNVQTATAPADSSESSSASNPNPSKNPFSSFSFGNSFGNSGGGIPSGSLFQPFASASAAVSQSQTAAAAASASAASSSSVVQQSQPQVVSGGNNWSPESSGIVVRSSLEDDAVYENDTTSSSNKLHSENEVSNEADNQDNEDREADCDEANEEREAEGVDS